MNQKPTIRIDCEVKDYAHLDSLQPFQGELKSLSKENYEKLRREIVEFGFAFPIHVWSSPEKINFIIGGHQRLRVLKELRDAEGFEIPQIPIIKIKASSFNLAKRRVLQDASQYGKPEGQGLYQFMIENDLDPGEFAKSFDLPNINLTAFNAEFFHDTALGDDDQKIKEGAKELNEEEFNSFDHKCPRCGFEFDN